MNITKDGIRDHYRMQIAEASRRALREVLLKNNLPFRPECGTAIRPVPVYEESGFNLLNYAERFHETEITWPAKQADLYVPAYYKRFRKADGKFKNQIIVASENYCQARFFAAKELMHCLLEEENYPATNSIGLVTELIDELAAGFQREHIAPQTAVDEFAYLGAALFLIPNGWIPLLKVMIEDVQRMHPEHAQHAYLHVARTIRVPEMLLRVVLRFPYIEDLTLTE